MSTKNKKNCQPELIDTGLTWSMEDCDPVEDIRRAAREGLNCGMNREGARNFLISIQFQNFIERLYFQGKLLRALKQILSMKKHKKKG